MKTRSSIKVDLETMNAIESLLEMSGSKTKANFAKEAIEEKLEKLKREKYYEIMKDSPELIPVVKKLVTKVEGIEKILKRAKWYADPSVEDPHTEIHMHPLDDIKLNKLLDEDKKKKKKT